MPNDTSVRLIAEPVPSKFASIGRYMFILMLRNFATSQWVFSRNIDGRRVRSKPGCIIASPSVPADEETTEDYVNFWVRDGALTVNECIYRDLPSNEMLDDYIEFSHLVQQTAIDHNRPAHACFRIDGTLRPWGEQGDGPALRVLSILEIWDHLSDDAKALARTVLARDEDYITHHHQDKSDNAWEEIHGRSFFTRAAQRRALERLHVLAPKVGLPRNDRFDAIHRTLSDQLEEHWSDDLGHYRSIMDGKEKTEGDELRGHELNCDLLFAVTYAHMPCFTERMLRTAAKLRAFFEKLYPINAHDAALDMGPSIGRYPKDHYDGTIGEWDDQGHPWPLCTANLARFYYQCAVELGATTGFEITGPMAEFFGQTGVGHSGQVEKASQRYKEVLVGLVGAGDRLMRAIVYHSDHLELSEQTDRQSGMCRSVRSLTWSYSSFLAASRTREKAMTLL